MLDDITVPLRRVNAANDPRLAANLLRLLAARVMAKLEQFLALVQVRGGSRVVGHT